MKAKLIPFLLALSVTAIAVTGWDYVAALNARTRSLEARLALLEHAVNGEKLAAAQALPAPVAVQPGPPGIFYIPNGMRNVTVGSSLEGRVEKIEQQLTPHLEPIPLAR